MYGENLYKRNKHLSVHTKIEHKKMHNNWKSVSLWQYVFRELWDSHRYCLVVLLYSALQTEVINHTVANGAHCNRSSAGTKKWIYNTVVSYTAKYFLKVGTHCKVFFCYNGEYQEVFTFCSFILVSLGSLNWDTNKNTENKEDTWRIFRKAQKVIRHPAFIQIQWLLRS